MRKLILKPRVWLLFRVWGGIDSFWLRIWPQSSLHCFTSSSFLIWITLVFSHLYLQCIQALSHSQYRKMEEFYLPNVENPIHVPSHLKKIFSFLLLIKSKLCNTVHKVIYDFPYLPLDYCFHSILCISVIPNLFIMLLQI